MKTNKNDIYSLLQDYISHDDFLSLEILLEGGIGPESLLPNGFSPVKHAIKSHSLDCLELLFQYGAIPPQDFSWKNTFSWRTIFPWKTIFSWKTIFPL